jgi:hypothetical protein
MCYSAQMARTFGGTSVFGDKLSIKEYDLSEVHPSPATGR